MKWYDFSMSIAAVISPETIQRPILVDESDGPCEYCAAMTASAGKCCRCKCKLICYENMNGSGFQPPSAHHFHIELVVGVVGRRSVFEELCFDCYSISFREKYGIDPDGPPRTIS